MYHPELYQTLWEISYGTKRVKDEWKSSCAGPEGGGDRGSKPPKNHPNIGFPSNTGPGPLQIIKLLSQHSMLGHHRHMSETQ